MRKAERVVDSAAALIPSRPTLTKLREIAAGCTACELYKRGTHTVFGEGARRARVTVYVTNVVKHFKWEPRGKRRIHAKPNASEIAACRPWLEAELAVVEPSVVVCLGATAAQALLGRQFRVSAERGRWVKSPLAPYVLATVHPSSILRAPDDEARHAEIRRFVDDLRVVAAVI